jgi:RNA recognition motif-containing protein
MRGAGGVRAPGESMRGPGNRDDLPTLRVTNISEDTQENDLRELFGGFGKVARVYVGRDRETGAGKDFAFVSFDDKATAQKAIDKVNGRGYDNLILSVQWSRKFVVHVHYTPISHGNSSKQNLGLTEGRDHRIWSLLSCFGRITSGNISIASSTINRPIKFSEDKRSICN